MSILKKLNKSKGFTLIELLVVIAIIGVLATLILLQLSTARAKARDAKRIADVNQLRTAIELYYDDQGGSYPGDVLCPVPPQTDADCADNDPVAGSWVGNRLTGYMSARVLPVDPLDSGAYDYAWAPLAAASRHSNYHIYTDLERRNVAALVGDVDMDSTGYGGAPVNLTAGTGTEDCIDATPADCMYDLGQP